ncbi:MAG: hypothetical protein AAGC44_15200 [Planctomycetota bacterium]
MYKLFLNLLVLNLGLTMIGCSGPAGRVVPVVAGGADGLEPLGDLDLYLYNLDSGEVQRLTRTPQVREYDPAIDPAGQRIVYIAERSDSGLDVPTYHLMIRELKTGADREYTTYTNPIYRPAWSADGKKLAWYVKRDGRYEIQVRDMSTQRPAQDLGFGSDPTWGGKDSVLFYSDRDRPGQGPSELCFRQMGSGVVNDLGLFGTGFVNGYRDFSLLYSSLPTSQMNEAIWRLDSNNAQTRLTDPGERARDLGPVWADGLRAVVFTRVEASTGRIKVMLLNPGTPEVGPIELAVDGAEVVLTRGGRLIADRQ